MKRTIICALLAAALFFFPLMVWNFSMVAAQLSSNPGPENYDIRTDRSKASHAKLAEQRQKLTPQLVARKDEVVQARQDGQDALAQGIAGLQVIRSPLTGGPEIVGADLAGRSFLTAASGQARDQIVRGFVAQHAALYGLTAAQAAQLATTADYTNPAGNLAWVTLEQRFNGIPVFAGELRAGLTPDGELVRTVSNLAAGIDEAELRTTPAISAAQAVAIGAASIGANINANDLVLKSSSPDGRQLVFERGQFAEDIQAELVYFPLEVGLANLAWSMALWRDVPAYYIVVDAERGDLFFRKNTTNDQAQSATYSIYNDDSPGPLSPTNATPGSGIQGPGIARTTVTLVGNEAPNTFNNLGWITDGGNTTTGNNVDAGLDLVSPDGIDAGGRPTGSPSRVFNFAYNPPPLGADSPTGSDYRFGVVTNLFYWSNVFHDRLYQLGFTEAARNFQTNNFGRGGAGNDPVSAQAQDFSGTNNANFSTMPDGTPGRMQMYIFTGPTPDRDGGLDQEIVLHELTHGLSNRLHANATGLASTQAGGMGEGWSDFYARALLATADENVNGVYASGAYATLSFSGVGTNNYYYGIRRFPYAVKTNLGANGRSHNPLTFADIDPAQINLSDGAFPPAFVGSATEVHNSGEVWCMALLEVRARIINRLGFATGNQRALQIVTDGMKLDPVNPTFLDARNAILLADCAGFGGADEMDIWAGFATRGLGFSARVNGGISFTEAFDMPTLGLGNATFSDTTGCTPNGFADPGETLTLTVPLSNPFCTTNATGVTASVTGGGSANYGTINAGATATQNISYTVPANAQCGSTITVTVNVNSSLGAATRTFTLYIGQPVTIFNENFDGGVVPNLPVGWTSEVTGSGTNWVTQTAVPDSPPNYVFTSDPATTGSATLTSPNISIVSPTARLTFRQFHNTDTGFDGGVLEIKIGSGSFTDIIAAGGSFVTGGYNGTLATDPSCASNPNPLANRLAWTGNSEAYFTTTVNLPASAAGQTIQLRWRMGTDCSFGGAGWRIDNIVVIGNTICTPCGGGACPTVTSINPISGAAGASVTITGTNFTGVTVVKFANNVSATFTVNSDTQITATVPNGAVTGPITISKTGCPDVQTSTFTVTAPPACPTVSNINPASGAAGSSVTITGANFTGVTAVRFANNVTAAFTINGDTQIIATVPNGAVTGPITISKTGCPDVQTGAFTVNTGQPAELAVDDGTFEDALGLNIGGTIYAVNRLTPTSYPATLSAVAIFFRATGGVKVGDELTVLVGTHPGGDPDINAVTLQPFPVTVQALGQFNVYTVPNATINSGDFVVGFRMAHDRGVFPVAQDLTPPSKRRSYVSTTGTSFTIIDDVGANFASNFGIRARLQASMQCPIVTGINPTSGAVGSNVTITGTNFTGVTAVRFVNNVPAAFTVNSDTQITATAPNGAVTGPVTISKSGCPDTQTAAFTVIQPNPVPVLTGLSPSAATAGSPGLTFTVNGSNFVNGAVVRWNGSDRPTNFVSSTQLTAQITPADLAIAGTASVTVFNPAPGGGASNALTFAINNPVPAITSLSPNSVTAGGPGLMLTVTGANFIQASVVRWNGSDRPTTFVSNTQLRAAIPAPDLAAAGTANITVFTPVPGGGASSALNFIIDPPPSALRTVRVVASGAAPGGTAQVPIELVAQGGENALSFSLTFDPAVLGNAQAVLGADASGATLNANTSQTAQGRFGILLALPAGQRWAAGTRRLVTVSFTVAAGTAVTSTPLNFADQPVARELGDVYANVLTAVTYTPDTVMISAAQGYEADVAPRPTGSNNGTITITDWIQAGRFAAGLDPAAPGSEFQRADCAPKETLGDSRLTMADWVQAGRYAAGLDPVVAAGGPTTPTTSAMASSAEGASLQSAVTRMVRLVKWRCETGRDCTLAIELDAQGEENALGFSLNFDPAQWRFVSAGAGNDASQAALNVNADRAASGQVGLALALPAGRTLAAGTRQVVVVTFAAISASNAGIITIGFGDQPVAREVVDASARTLSVSYTVGAGIARPLANVSAASFSGMELASEEIAAAFGTNLATVTQTAGTLPLPTALAGTQVLVRDSAGIERQAPLFFVSPEQVNYQLPPGTAPGLATVTITSGDGTVSLGTVEIAAVAPGLFAANADGQGVAAAMVLRVRADGTQSYEPVAEFDPANNKFVAVPIDLGTETDEVFLILFGTGLRFRSSLSAVSAKLGGVEMPVLYAGEQGQFVGLDQVNLRLPRNLAGRGEVDVAAMVDGKTANTVKVHLK